MRLYSSHRRYRLDFPLQSALLTLKSELERTLFKFVTLYRRVDDENLLENFFSETHLPLAEQLPGLRKTEVSRVSGKPGGESRFHLMYELYFDSGAQYREALLSEPGLKLMQALKPWGEAKLIIWFYAESWQEKF